MTTLVHEETRATRPTVDLDVDRRHSTPGAWMRRAWVSVLAVVVVLGLVEVFGVRSSTVVAQNDGASLAVHYASVARAGLSTPFEITVHRADGFDGPVVLAVSRNYLDLFNVNSIDPQPDSETADASDVVWHFNRPRTNTLVVSVDLQVQSGRHRGTTGHVVLEQRSGRRVARVTFRTALAP